VRVEEKLSQPVHEMQVSFAVRQRGGALIRRLEELTFLRDVLTQKASTSSSRPRSAASTRTSASCWIRGSEDGRPSHSCRVAVPSAVSS
jgi:hypothetical protein